MTPPKEVAELRFSFRTLIMSEESRGSGGFTPDDEVIGEHVFGVDWITRVDLLSSLCQPHLHS